MIRLIQKLFGLFHGGSSVETKSRLFDQYTDEIRTVEIELALHDLNNLMMTISSNLDRLSAQILASGTTLSDEGLLALEKARAAADRSIELSSGVGKLSKTKGTQRLDISEAIALTINLLPARLTKSVRVVHQAKHSTPVFVNVPLLELYRVLTNLVVNACQAIESQIDKLPAQSISPGTVTIVTEPTESGVKIFVVDSGPGVDEKVRYRILKEPGVTTKTLNDHSLGGRGLGLFGARRIIEAHGGRLSLQSTEKGAGATFLLELPHC